MNVNHLKLSQRGIELIQGYESCQLIAYRDVRGVWTIGWGHTGPDVAKGLRWTMAEAVAHFQRDVQWAEDCVNRLVRMPLTQNQFDALVSFVFNEGETNFRQSTMLVRINAGNFAGARTEFRRFNKVRDPASNTLVVSRGLTNRRAAEAALFGEA